jgi:hypothetical protein
MTDGEGLGRHEERFGSPGRGGVKGLRKLAWIAQRHALEGKSERVARDLDTAEREGHAGVAWTPQHGDTREPGNRFLQ